jgi:tRNA dimethylallyltransferase
MSSTGDSAVADAPLHIITGPTGAGKSALAMRLAERHGAMIVSADSRQVYRHFDIGTAKPARSERERVWHEGIDVADPEERWSAALFASAAEEWIRTARAQGKPVLVVGGTGLWLRALVHPLAPEPVMDQGDRRRMQSALGTLETPELRRWVRQLDPTRATLGRTQLLRAAEVVLLSGTRLSDWHARAPAGRARPARWLVVDPGPTLQVTLATRLDAMLAGGWEEEVRRLVAQVPADAPAWNACGYEVIRDVVDGRLTRDEARELVLIATRQYAKRQRTWFRHQLRDEPHVMRLDPHTADADAVAEQWFLGGVHA